MQIKRFVAACDYVLNILLPVREPVKPPPVLLVTRIDTGFQMTLIRGSKQAEGFGRGYTETYKKLLGELEALEGD